MGDQLLLAISAYLPTFGKDDEYLECDDDLSNFILENKKTNEIVLIGTDSNCSDKSTSRRKAALSSLCTELALTKLCTSHPTFHHHNGASESVIDYFLLSTGCIPTLSNLVSLCTQDCPENLSSVYVGKVDSTAAKIAQLV